MDSATARRIVRAVYLTEICSCLSNFQLAALAISCQAGVPPRPLNTIIAEALNPGEGLFLYGLMHDPDGRGQILEAIDLEQNDRRAQKRPDR